MIAWLTRGRPLSKVSPGMVLRPARDVLTARRDGAAVLLDLRREQYLSLDETAAVIWEEVEAGADMAMICERLHHEFDAPESVLKHDAELFLRELMNRGLVVQA